MSKADNLKDFLTDVADAIRAKKGTTDLINPQNFSAEIATLSGGLEVIEMTETTATIEPNKVYVWGMVESLNITLGASTDASDFFAFRFRCSKPTMTSVTVNGATWADDTELDAGGKPVLDLGSWYQCEIKGGTSALYARLAHYIPFEDSNVEAVLMSKGVGDGIGITYKDAAKVTTISTWFKSNADITSFDELKYFTGVTALENFAFYGCSALKSITLPSSISSISSHAFNSCTVLEEVKNFENTSIEILQDEIFRGTSLKSIVLPRTVTLINTNAFYGCSSLREIAFPESLTRINGGAFYGCSSLREVVLKEGFTAFSRNNIFQDCTSLLYVKLPSTLKSNLTEGIFRGCTSLLKVEGLENSQIPIIQGSAFYDCSALTEIAFPASLTSIENDAFYGCSALTEIAFPASLTSIGNDAFRDCTSLVTASGLGYTQLTSIGNDAFNGCSALTEIAFPASLTSIGNFAFRGCTSLVTASGLGDTQLTSIGGSAFNGCSALTEIAFPASLTSIGNSAFSKTVIYGEFTFENLQTLGSRAFENTKVSKMKFPSLVSSEASSNFEGIFSYCTNLVLVDIGDKCTTIKSNSFGRFVGTSGNDITFIIRAITPPELADRLISTQWVRAKIGVIYVPDESLEAYKTATNWSYYADILKPLSEYTNIT